MTGKSSKIEKGITASHLDEIYELFVKHRTGCCKSREKRM